MKRMKRLYNITLILLLLLFASAGASAQIRGVITDSLTHEPLMYITVQYEGKGVGGISNADGEYQVETRKGWNELTFSAIGYITKKVKFAPGTKVLNVALAPADVMLSEVVVKPKKEKYSRKNNPAVEFMKKVIEHKKALKLEENDFYQYQKYEKMKMSINDVTPEKMEKGIYKKFSFFKDQVEVSPKTNKMILPISIKETASRTIYRKSPKSEKTHHLARFIAIAADKATTMGHIKREELAKAEVLIPCEEDYTSLTSIMQPIFELIISNRIEARKLAALRDELLPKLMSGEIDVSAIQL